MEMNVEESGGRPIKRSGAINSDMRKVCVDDVRDRKTWRREEEGKED